jgi:DNA-binding transcriptional regulator WhiA
MTQRRLKDLEKIEAVAKFETGEYSYTSLAKEYGITVSAMYALMKRKGAKVPTSGYFTVCKRHYNLNENFFDNIDTEEKAYFLGFLYADGCHYEDLSCITLSLQEEDKEILNKLNETISSNRPLMLVKHSKYKSTLKNQYKLSLNSKKISKNLSRLGLMSRKSLILKFPTEEQVPHHLLKHFIRGYFDGDGSISYWVEKKAQTLRLDCSFVSTECFCNSLAIYLLEELDITTKIKTRFKERNNSTRTILIRRKPAIHKFMSWLYQDSTIYLQRKYDKYNELKTFENNWTNRNK